MKSLKFFAVLSILLLFSANIFAQEKEMTEEEWQSEINRLTAQKNELTKELNSLQNDVNNLKSTKTGLQSYDDCMNELYALVGASEAEVAKFRTQIADVNGRIGNDNYDKEDIVAQWENLSKNKISALPEFFDKVHNQMKRALDAWDQKPKEIMYTVVRGDHLWGIAKKKEHYGNGFAWPVIYRANRDQIKDPDLIYPKQVFKIPNLTEEEKAKYEKARANYKPAPPAQN
ncbi:MAG: LysM peptidoglycan-binding domain-containing protein [Melioribacteraceae bacterium]|nr:LysM peptidoglycan-binding domain-containing protein [Melioribacteraceae bacterium]